MIFALLPVVFQTILKTTLPHNFHLPVASAPLPLPTARDLTVRSQMLPHTHTRFLGTPCTSPLLRPMRAYRGLQGTTQLGTCQSGFSQTPVALTSCTACFRICRSCSVLVTSPCGLTQRPGSTLGPGMKLTVLYHPLCLE